jgi:peptidoglycan hydrolase CwlO-like protein
VVVQRLKSERTVMKQRRNRLNEQYDSAQKEMKELAVSVQHMQHDTTRLNALIAKNTELQQMLTNDNFLLEMKVRVRRAVAPASP